MNTTAPADAYLEAIRELVRQEVLATLRYAVAWEYVIVTSSASADLVDAFPADPTAGMPPITWLKLSDSIGGLPAVGQHVAIGFLDANPAKPLVLGVRGALNSFVSNFITWIPMSNDGGAALKTLITAWMAKVGYVP